MRVVSHPEADAELAAAALSIAEPGENPKIHVPNGHGFS
jgi:hypothetical protein